MLREYQAADTCLQSTFNPKHVVTSNAIFVTYREQKHLGNLAVSNPSQRSAINQEEYLGNQAVAVLSPRSWPRDFRSAATSRVIFMLHKTRPDSHLKGWMDESCSDNPRIPDIWNSATAFRTTARLSRSRAFYATVSLPPVREKGLHSLLERRA